MPPGHLLLAQDSDVSTRPYWQLSFLPEAEEGPSSSEREEALADEDHLRASWAPYQLAHGRPLSDVPLMGGPVPVRTLLLYGPDDHVVGTDFLPAVEAAFPDRVGPLVVPGAGHFVQWERADIVNALLIAVFGDRIGARSGSDT